AARPAVGKTALALNFAYRAATRAKTPVAIFSLEMSSELLVRRLIASESLIPLKNLSTGKLSGEQRLKLNDAVKRVGGAPIYIDDTPGNKLMDIIAKSRKLQAKEPDLGLIVVDYLGLVETSGNKGDSRQEEVRKISLALKQLAMELKVPVLALSQLSRDVEKQNRKPQLSDLRDSGSIEQDADVVMLLHREDYGKESKQNKVGNKKLNDLTPDERKKLSYGQQQQMLAESMSGDASYVDVIIAKNRNGQTDNVPLFFYKSYGRFDTPPKEWQEQMRALAQMDEAAN
ncbi:MAG: DnaB-like helicase C-terminal domain-containing protein, partial [Bacilli bacterium]|nr:DnaB-like helicase C-terminal domain-containing protein [Bacilli bacterium]